MTARSSNGHAWDRMTLHLWESESTGNHVGEVHVHESATGQCLYVRELVSKDPAVVVAWLRLATLVFAGQGLIGLHILDREDMALDPSETDPSVAV
jgi:hypothetical protein